MGCHVSPPSKKSCMKPCMVYPLHMDHLEQGNTSGPSQLDILRPANFSFRVPVWVELLLPPSLEMTTSVRVGILSQETLMMLHLCK